MHVISQAIFKNVQDYSKISVISPKLFQSKEWLSMTKMQENHFLWRAQKPKYKVNLSDSAAWKRYESSCGKTGKNIF